MACEDCKKLKEQIEQLHVQLAGCGVAVFGHAKDCNDAKQGDYGWSVPFNDIKILRMKYEKLLKKVEEMAEVCGFALEIDFKQIGG